MIELELKGLDALQKKLKRMPDTIAAANVDAMRNTTRIARKAARIEAERVFDNPRPQTIRAIDNRWPNKAQVKAGRGEAAVFVKNFLVDEIYPNVFRAKETAVPNSSGSILEPSKKVRLNKFGNVPGLRTGKVQKFRKNRDKYLSVPIGSDTPQTNHLKPGLYQIMGGKSRNRSRARAKLKLLFVYEKERTISTQKFRRYPAVVMESYRENYGREFFKALIAQMENRR